MAFAYAEPALAQGAHSPGASRQFEEGDVQHWWHPQSGRGVRTRFSDDLVWLPYVVNHYLGLTGDSSVLDADSAVPLDAPAECGRARGLRSASGIGDRRAGLRSLCSGAQKGVHVRRARPSADGFW